MMRLQLKPETRARRLAAVVGFVVTLGAALVAAIPAANAALDQPARTALDSTVPVSANGTGVASASTIAPASQMERRLWSATLSDCRAFEICIWSGDNFTGAGIFFSGNYDPCEGWRLEGTVWQDHTWSIWNRASGPITIWDRYPDGSYSYNKYALLPSGYRHGVRFSYIMDAWVYDPGNNCTRLFLWPAHNPD